jgi:hypothetical protein
MNLVVWRIILGAAFLWVCREAYENARVAPESGDLINAFLLAVALIVGLANAAVWAPFFGRKVSEPLTGVLTESTYVERPNRLLRWIHGLEPRGHQRGIVWCCYLAALLHPDQPTAYLIGLKHARPGSSFERFFALGVFRFDNTQNCLWAHSVLRRQGINPGAHRNPEVNLALRAQARSASPERTPLPLPRGSEPAALQRNPRIQLFVLPSDSSGLADVPAPGSPGSGQNSV